MSGWISWIQVEVTSRCDARCSYCPRSAYAGSWLSGDLAPQHIDTLLEELPSETLVHLQGWGEPLLRDDVVELVEKVASRGHPVTLTTNANRLTPELASRLFSGGLRVLGVSMAGLDEVNDSIRVGTSSSRILRGVEAAREAAEKVGSGRVHAAYMLLASYAGRLSSDLLRLSEAGTHQVVVSTLDLVVSEELLKEATWALGEADWKTVLEAVDEARKTASKHGISLVLQLAPPRPKARRCPEGEGRSAYVGFDGSVSPCVMRAVPVGRGAMHWSRRGPVPLEREVWGVVGRGKLKSLVTSKAFRRARGGGLFRGPSKRCLLCGKLGTVAELMESISPLNWVADFYGDGM